METPKIFESEYRFCQILWVHEPVKSRELVALCAEHLGWKPTTTYTVIKRLSEEGLAVCQRKAGDHCEYLVLSVCELLAGRIVKRGNIGADEANVSVPVRGVCADVDWLPGNRIYWGRAKSECVASVQ